jgi:aryl sulfotransferase
VAQTWPNVTRVVQNHHLDSTNWQAIAFREGDVVVANWAKSGATWTQQIVCQLIHGGREDARLIELSLWPEWRTIPKPDLTAWSNAFTTRRIFKTHLPADAVPLAPEARYIYVARDPRDVVWSLHPHHQNMSEQLYQGVNESPGLVGHKLPRPDPDIRGYYHAWLDRDGYPYWPFWSHVQSWWDVRDQPNVMLLHFEDLKAEPTAQIRRIAAFIGAEIDPATWPRIVEHCSFDWMRSHSDGLVSTDAFADGARSFVNKGVNGRWRDVLSEAEISKCDEIAAANLSADCLQWLTGRTPR